MRLASVAAAQAVLIVGVGEEGTGAFVEGAQVILPDAKRLATTDWKGEAVIRDLEAGSQRVQVRRIGFASFESSPRLVRDTTFVFVSLRRIVSAEQPAAALDTVRIAARGSDASKLREFVIRRSEGIGRFLSDSVLLANHGATIAILFEQRFAGVRTVPDPQSPTRRTVDCALFLDGQKFLGVLDDIQPGALAGVEYYRSATSVPVQYKERGVSSKVFGAFAMKRDCTILMWSK